MKYTFISKEQPGLIYGSGTETERTVSFNAHELSVVLEEFELFLKGCGFSFDGHIDIVDDNGESNVDCPCENEGCDCKWKK